MIQCTNESINVLILVFNLIQLFIKYQIQQRIIQTILKKHIRLVKKQGQIQPISPYFEIFQIIIQHRFTNQLQNILLENSIKILNSRTYIIKNIIAQNNCQIGTSPDQKIYIHFQLKIPHLNSNVQSQYTRAQYSQDRQEKIKNNSYLFVLHQILKKHNCLENQSESKSIYLKNKQKYILLVVENQQISLQFIQTRLQNKNLILGEKEAVQLKNQFAYDLVINQNKDNILNKLMYFNDKEDEQRYNEYYLKQHYKMMYFVYIIVFCVNVSILQKILIDFGFEQIDLLPIIINQMLVIFMLISIKRKSSIFNKLSFLINVVFAVEFFYYQKRFRSNILNDYYELCGFIIYGAHSSLMLSSQLFYDSLGFIFIFILYSFQLYKRERIIEILLMWCIIIISIYQKFQHHKFTRFLYVSMQHQQQWIDVIENVLPSAIISIQRDKNSLKQNHDHNLAKSDFLHNTQINIQSPKDKNILHQNFNKMNTICSNFQKQNINQTTQKMLQKQSHIGQSQPLNNTVTGSNAGMNQQPAVDASVGSPRAEIESDENLLKGWNLNLVNGQSKEMYNIRDMESFVSFTQNVLIDTRELMMETSTAINGNISSPLNPLEAIRDLNTKQIDMSNIANNQINFTINPNSIPPKKLFNSGNTINNSSHNINSQQNPIINAVNQGNTSLTASPIRYSLKGHTQNNIDIFTFPSGKNSSKKNYDKQNIDQITENNTQVNNYGQLYSGVLTLQADGGNPYITLFRQLLALFEDSNYDNKKPKFFIWKLNGKYYPPCQQKGNEQNSIVREQGNCNQSINQSNHNISKERSTTAVAIQIKICGFRGQQTRIVLCIDDISISEKIQLYQSQDKYKDLVLANAAHDLRQPLNSLNFTILEAKKLLDKLLNQNIYSFLYQFYPKQFFMIAQVHPTLRGLITNLTSNRAISSSRMNLTSDRNNLTSDRINQTDLNSMLTSNNNQLNVSPTLFQDCTELQIISDLLDMADVSGSSLKYLINDILDHAKLREGKLQVNFKACSLKQIFQFTKKMFEFSFKERGIKYRIINQTEGISDTICTDQQRLQQVLINLLSNSIKFTSTNKYIILHITRVIKKVHNRDVSLLKISVLDQGCGMSSEQLQQIFKPYVSFNNNNLNIEGIGLGLNICKSIIGLLGPYPKLYVRSKQNEGTKFFFYVYHQLRKGSTAFKDPSNRIQPKSPRKFRMTKDSNRNSDEKINEERKPKLQLGSVVSSTQKLEEISLNIKKQKEENLNLQENSKKNSDQLELKELNEAIGRTRTFSIIDQTSRQNNDLSFKLIQTENIDKNNSIILNKETQPCIDDQNITKNNTPCHTKKNLSPDDSYQTNIEQDKYQQEDECFNQTLDENKSKDDDDEKNSNLNMTSIIMQLPDLDEEEFIDEMQSPSIKYQKLNLLQKYSQTGQMINPITSLNSYRSSYNKQTPRSENNLTILENTLQLQKTDYYNENASFLNNSKSNLRDLGEVFYQQTARNNKEGIFQNINTISINNTQYSDSNMAIRRASNFGLGEENNMQKGQQTVFSKQLQNSLFNYNSDQTQHKILSTNQTQTKYSQFINNNTNFKENNNQNQSNIGEKLNQYHNNSIESIQSTKTQSFRYTANNMSSISQPIKTLNNQPPTISNINENKNIVNKNNNGHSGQKIKRSQRNLPSIITQFHKKYPNNGLNEFEQSSCCLIVGQKEELQVLVVDDDAFNLQILKMMLKKSDQFTFEIKECHNGRDSLQEFQKRNKPTSEKPFDLIITDINMPIMNGIESTKQMRKAILEQNYHEATFIGISGIDEEQIINDPDQYSDYKIFDVTLSKPLKEQAIINAINQNFLDFY